MRCAPALDDDALHTLRHSQQAAGRVPRNLLTLPELVRLALDTSDDDEDGDGGRSQDPVLALLGDERPIAEWTVAERTAFLRRLVDESLASTVRGRRASPPPGRAAGGGLNADQPGRHVYGRWWVAQAMQDALELLQSRTADALRGQRRYVAAEARRTRIAQEAERAAERCERERARLQREFEGRRQGILLARRLQNVVGAGPAAQAAAAAQDEQMEAQLSALDREERAALEEAENQAQQVAASYRELREACDREVAEAAREVKVRRPNDGRRLRPAGGVLIAVLVGPGVRLGRRLSRFLSLALQDTLFSDDARGMRTASLGSDRFLRHYFALPCCPRLVLVNGPNPGDWSALTSAR